MPFQTYACLSHSYPSTIFPKHVRNIAFYFNYIQIPSLFLQNNTHHQFFPYHLQFSQHMHAQHSISKYIFISFPENLTQLTFLYHRNSHNQSLYTNTFLTISTQITQMPLLFPLQTLNIAPKTLQTPQHIFKKHKFPRILFDNNFHFHKPPQNSFQLFPPKTTQIISHQLSLNPNTHPPTHAQHLQTPLIKSRTSKIRLVKSKSSPPVKYLALFTSTFPLKNAFPNIRSPITFLSFNYLPETRTQHCILFQLYPNPLSISPKQYTSSILSLSPPIFPTHACTTFYIKIHIYLFPRKLNPTHVSLSSQFS